MMAVSARASVLYYDDFQQFPSGTVLTQTNYFPNIGIDANIDTNQDGFNVPTVTASNLLGSVRAFVDLATVPYSANYRGDINGGAITNQDFKLTFNLWIAALKTASHVGGIGVDMLTTNIDSIDGTTTNLSRNPVIFINDGGQVYAFTNNADSSAPLSTVAQIGSWSAHVGTVMSNAFIVSFTSNTWTYIINGVTLTNMPIPRYVTNILNAAGLEVFEAISGGGVTSLGNKFAFDDIELTAGPANTNQDVLSYIAAAKGQFFDQLTAGVPTMSTTGWAFHSDILGSSSNSLLDASLTVPGGAVKTLLPNSPGDSKLEFNDQFTSQAALDAAYHSSAPYTLTVDTADQGTFRPTMLLPSDSYPTNAPQIVNFAAAQAINSTTNFVLQWAAFAGGTTSDLISVSIDDNLGNTAFGSPDVDASNVLDGTVTSILIPGNTLAAGTPYQGQLIFVKVTSTDTNSVPGALGQAGFFKQTIFSLVTTSPATAAVVCSLAPVIGTNTINTTYTATATVTTNGTPAAGVVVNFDVIAGPNLGNNGTSSTDGSGHASFSYSSAVTGTDTVQAAGLVSSLSFTGTATEVWLAANIPPVAVCQNVTVPTSGGCQANVTAAQVDNGSFDPDGTIVSRVLSPAGPYSLGVTPVTLTVTDDRGATNSCSATITVVDQTPPIVLCPSDVVTNVLFGITNAVVIYPAPVASDNCSLASTNSAPPSGSTFGLGTNVVTFTAVDAAGNTNSCHFNVIVNQVAPQADLALTAAANVATASLNNPVSYTLVVTNKGPQDATGAQLVDALPDSVAYSNATSSAGTCTNIGGVVTCDFGTLTNGTVATVTVIVTPTNSADASVCSAVTVTNSLVDPVTANNSTNICTPVVIDNLAVTAFKAPKKVALTAKKPSVTSKLSVTIQNRSLHAETVPNLAVLSNLVTITLSPLGTNVCSLPVAQLVPPKAFPITLTSGKTLNIAYTVTFTCATDPLATTKTANHNDYQYLVTVHHEALDGIADSRPADDTCPHDALGVDPYNKKIKDKGCGVKNPDGSFGPVVTDIIDTRAP
jgi:uncharacterized repeat protein (TIGR01451 family)